MQKKYKIRYGGSSCDQKEYLAVMRSVEESIATGGWQQGKQGALLERELSRFLKVKHAILTTSGSCAGLLALSALELPKGSEVIISAVTFPTIFNIILQCGLVPVVVDAKVGTYNFDIEDVRNAITDKTSAVIAIHALGNPCDMPALMRLVDGTDIKVIEDNCDGIGGKIGSRMIGAYGHVSITSFHAAHIVSMGVGGGVFTDDSELARRVRQYRDWGRVADTTQPHSCKQLPKDYNPRFVYDKIGYNFQILDLQAAMGRVQLRKAGRIKRMRKANFDYLLKHLSKHGDLVMPKWMKKADVCWFAFPISVTNGVSRGKLVDHLEKSGIETRSLFAGQIHKHPAYANSDYRLSGDLTESEHILNNSFWISVHPRNTKKDNDYIIKAFNDFFR